MNIKEQLAMQARYNSGNFEGSRRITPDAIKKMAKGDVRELLDTHGADVSGGVAEMRERLIAIMFMGDL